MTQQEICNKLLPTILNAPVYEKFGTFKYRYAGEHLKTIVDGKIETEQFLSVTSGFVVIGPKNEEFFVPIDKFNDRYEIVTEAIAGKSTGQIKAKGQIHAIKVTTDNFIPSFVAGWGTKMTVTLGGWYACPVGGTEVYFIDEQIFKETYYERV